MYETILPASTLTLHSGVWKESEGDLDKMLVPLAKGNDASPRYILVGDSTCQTTISLTPTASKHFKVPQHLQSMVYQKSNGFYTYGTSFDDNDRLSSYNCWIRFMIKQGKLPVAVNGGYEWYNMTFFSSWEPGNCSVLCLGVPPVFQNTLQGVLTSIWCKNLALEPYGILVPIFETVIAMHDTSIWFFREIIRGVEKSRASEAHLSPGFAVLHETTRHAIHSVETLHVAINTLEAARQAHLSLRPSTNTLNPASTSHHLAQDSINTHLTTQTHLLRAFLQRSTSFKERIQNEISMAYSIIAQRDSQVMLSLGRAAKADSSITRSIATVTMIFLPPTFVAEMFSTSFFSFDSQASPWTVSNAFWVYWVLAIPLTGLTVMLWLWHRKSDMKRVESGEKGDVGDVV